MAVQGTPGVGGTACSGQALPEEMVVLVEDSDVPSSIRVVWSFWGGPRWGPHSCVV